VTTNERRKQSITNTGLARDSRVTIDSLRPCAGWIASSTLLNIRRQSTCTLAVNWPGGAHVVVNLALVRATTNG
jgi:hypothetical protein